MVMVRIDQIVRVRSRPAGHGPISSLVMRSPLARRGLAAVALATCASLVAPLWPTAPASAATTAASGSTSTSAIPGDAEYLFTRMLNKERTSRGLRALRLDTALSTTSRTWSREMDSSNTLKHDPNLVAHVSR